MIIGTRRSKAIALVLALLASACGSPADQQLHTFSAERGEPSLVVVFRLGTSDQEIFRVVTHALSKSVDDATGSYTPWPGTRSMIKEEVLGHVAYEMAFRRDADPGDLESVRQRAIDAPSVLAVFVNVGPNAINADMLSDIGQSPNPSLQRTRPKAPRR